MQKPVFIRAVVFREHLEEFCASEVYSEHQKEPKRSRRLKNKSTVTKQKEEM